MCNAEHRTIRNRITEALQGLAIGTGILGFVIVVAWISSLLGLIG